MSRRAGILTLTIDGQHYSAHGSFTVGFGVGHRTTIIGSDGQPLGFKELMTQPPFIQGELIDSGGFSISAMTRMEEGVATLVLASGKTLILRGAFYASGDQPTISSTENGTITFRLEGKSIEEVLAA